MATGVDTLISPAMVESKGNWSEPRLSPPISASDIRKWAIATYWPEPPPPIYWDEAYAKTTRWGGIIAPPDFNPFAWPVRRMAPPAAAQPAGGVRLTGMNGGQTDTYGAPMRPRCARNASDGRCVSGEPNATDTPASMAASASDAATLFAPSPTNAIERPRSVPNRSPIVSRSASA